MFETRRSSRIDSYNNLLEIVTLISFLIMDIVQYPKSIQQAHLRVANRYILGTLENRIVSALADILEIFLEQLKIKLGALLQIF